MKNFYDSWQVILDDRGKPLVGKILFCEANTTDIVLKTVYTVDGQELDNPIYCNVVPSTQVMLGDGDYTVRFYRYIGHGNMESDENEDSWLLYKTELIKDGVVSGSSSGTIGLVDDVLHLKNWKGMEDGDVMEVLGYYTTEDCPARYFVWHANGNYRDDGGVIITSNTTTKGAWVMKIPGTYIDVRWYGDIPSRSASGVTSNMGQRTNAANAANKYNKDLYFPAYTSGTDNGFYLFDGSNTVSVAKDIICDDGVRFVVKEGTVGTSIICHELQKCEKYLFISSSASTPIGEYSIIANWVNTSWISKDGVGGNARVGYVIDYLNTPMTFKDTKIKFERDGLNVSNCVFNNCEFVDCNRNIDKSVTMYNMDIDYKWFANDYNFANLTIYDCKITLHNCKDADQYIMLKNKQNDYNYGDLGEQSIDNADVYAGGTLENFYGSITLKSAGNYEIHNASVTINGVNASTTLNLVDCWTTFGGNYSVCGGLELRRGALNGSKPLQMLSVGAFNLYDADVGIYLKLYGLSGFTINNCKIYNTIQIIGHNHFYIINNIFETNSKIEYAGDADGMYGIFKNNIIKYDSLGWHYSSNIANTTVGIVWSGNHSDMTNHFIILDRTNFKTNDSAHTYVYKDNTGLNTLQQNTSKVIYGYVEDGMFPSQQTGGWKEDAFCILAGISKRNDEYTMWEGIWWNYWNRTADGVKTGLWLYQDFFAVGTTVRVVEDFQIYPTKNGESPAYTAYMRINGHDFQVSTQPTICTLTLNTDSSSLYNYKVDPPLESVLKCNGCGNLSTPFMSAVNMRFMMNISKV